MKKHMNLKKCISLMGVMSLALTACNGNTTTQPADTEKAAASSSQAELSGFAQVESMLTDGDVYTYVTIGGQELLLHASDAVTNDSGKTYASSADVIGIDLSGNASMYGFANNYLDGQYIATDGEHLYSVTDTYIIKYDIKDSTLHTSEYALINEILEDENEEGEEGGKTSVSKTEYLYSIDGEVTEMSDDSKYQEMLEVYKALEPIEFKVIGENATFKYSDLSSLLYPVGVTYEDEVAMDEVATDVNYDDQVETLPELSEENPIEEVPEDVLLETEAEVNSVENE